MNFEEGEKNNSLLYNISPTYTDTIILVAAWTLWLMNQTMPLSLPFCWMKFQATTQCHTLGPCSRQPATQEESPASTTTTMSLVSAATNSNHNHHHHSKKSLRRHTVYIVTIKVRKKNVTKLLSGGEIIITVKKKNLVKNLKKKSHASQ